MNTNSNYQNILSLVYSLKCNRCNGSGLVNTIKKQIKVTCTQCYGSGWQDAAEERSLVKK